MDDVIQGQQCYMIYSGITLGGVKGFSQSLSKPSRDTTFINSGGWTKRTSGKLKSWSLSINGLVLRGNEDGATTYLINQIINNDDLVDVALAYETVGDTYYVGSATIVSMEISGSHDGDLTYSIELEGSGELTPTVVSA